MKISQNQKCETKTTHFCGLFPLNFNYAIKTLTRLKAKANEMKSTLEISRTFNSFFRMHNMHFIKIGICQMADMDIRHSKLFRQLEIQPENQEIEYTKEELETCNNIKSFCSQNQSEQ